MSFPDERRRNDEYGWIEEAAAALLAASRDLVGRGDQRIRSPSAVDLATPIISQHNQRRDLGIFNTANTAQSTKRPDNNLRLTGQLARPRPVNCIFS